MRALNPTTPQAVPASALERLYLAHHEMVLRSVYRLTRSMGDAEDVLHSLFVKLMQREEPLAADANLGPYLHRAAVNLGLNILRQRQWSSALDGLPERAGEGDDPLTFVSRQQLGDRLRAAIASLPQTAAEAFVLRHVEGYSNSEVARLLGVSAGSVAVTLHRARRRLQKELATERRALS
jgi:RNA polymerase sigma-70 factor (ECF subfamily)